MNEKTKVKIIAKKFLDNSMGDTLYHAKRTLRLAHSEFNDRIKNIDHMNEKQQMDTKRRVADAIEKQLGVIIEIHPEVFDSVDEKDGTLNTKEMVKYGINTKYLYVSCYETEEIETELNKESELLVGLIHEIVVGRY